MSDTCFVHGTHRPQPVTLHDHHIQPKAMGGPTEALNLVKICPTGHANVHAALAALVFDHPMPKVTRNEKNLALAGFRRWVDAGKPGNPHAAYGLHADPAGPA